MTWEATRMSAAFASCMDLLVSPSSLTVSRSTIADVLVQEVVDSAAEVDWTGVRWQFANSWTVSPESCFLDSNCSSASWVDAQAVIRLKIPESNIVVEVLVLLRQTGNFSQRFPIDGIEKREVGLGIRPFLRHLILI